MARVSFIPGDTSDSYVGFRNPKTKTVSVMYDDKMKHDEEKMYEFRPDGSASAMSCAWGVKTELPPGTFSDVIAKLPKTEKLNKEMAQQLAAMYERVYSDSKK